MDNPVNETDTSHNSFTDEKTSSSKLDVYEDEYPIIWYEPKIESEEGGFKTLIEADKSIKLFSDSESAFKFAESLGISFLLIVSSHQNEQKLLQDFGVLKDTFSRRLFDIEEEAVLTGLLKGPSDEKRKSYKVYVFVTYEDFNNEAPVNEYEEDVNIMCDVKEMAKQFREEFTIICCDPEMNAENKEMLMNELDIEEKNIYPDFDDDLIRKLEDNTDLPYHIIVSGENQEKFLISKVNELKNLMCLYIYNNRTDVDKKQRNIKVEKTLKALIPRVKEGIRTKSKYKNVFPSFVSIFDAWDKSNINKAQYYLRGFPNFRNRKQAKKDFVNLAKIIYQSKKLFEFEKKYNEYDREQILQWYAEESPIYKLINNCLRILTSDSIQYCRLILKDLERAIREEHQQETQRFSGVVYRGAYISDDEYGKLSRNIGKEIEMCGFLSTSKSQKAASNFLNLDIVKKALITIIVPDLPLSELDEQGFVDITKSLKLMNEEEVLFNVRSRFQVLEVGMIQIGNENQKSECRHVVLFYGAQLLRKFMTIEKPLIKLEIYLPESLKCRSCESQKNLFAFSAKETEIICKGCFLKDETVEDTFLLPINDRSERIRKINFLGKMMKFDEQSKLTQFYGYKCNNCSLGGKEKYYKWIEIKGANVITECDQCFKKSEGNKSDYLLISEKCPYNFWRSCQNQWEEADVEFHTEAFEKSKELTGADIFLKIQNNGKCIEFCTKFLKTISRKRKREQAKLENFIIFGRGSENQGDHQKALEYMEQALKIELFIYGEVNSRTASSFNNIATVYQSLAMYQETLEHYMKALNITKLIYGETHRSMASLFNNIGVVYRILAMHQEALEYNMKAFKINQSNYGDIHPDTAISLNNIALVYSDLEKYQEALKCHKKACRIKKCIYGEAHSLTAISFNNIALASQNLGKHRKALKYHMKAINIWKLLHGEKHPDIATSFSNIADVYRDLRDYQRAQEYHIKALDIRKLIYGEMHSDTASSFNNIAVLYQELGKYQEALDYNMKALNINQSIYGKTHPETANSFYNIGLVHQSLGKHQEALQCFMNSLEIRKSIYGEMHSDTAASFNNIAFVSHSLGKYQEALEYNMKALNISQSIYSEPHSDTAKSFSNIASVYRDLGKYQEAIDYLKKALNIRKLVYGEEDPKTATSFDDIAVVHHDLGEYGEAINYFIKGLNIRKSIYGKEHPQTITSERNIANMVRKLRHEISSSGCVSDMNKVQNAQCIIISNKAEKIQRFMEKGVLNKVLKRISDQM